MPALDEGRKLSPPYMLCLINYKLCMVNMQGIVNKVAPIKAAGKVNAAGAEHYGRQNTMGRVDLSCLHAPYGRQGTHAVEERVHQYGPIPNLKFNRSLYRSNGEVI